MKPYTNYKDSGVDWVKVFPSHWDWVKSKYIYEKKSLSPQENDGVVTCFRDGEVTLRANRRMSGYTEADKEHGYQHVDIGDLVIHGMDAFAGAVGVSDSSGKMSPVCNICQAKIDVNNIYYGYIVKEMAIRGYILSLYRGIRERSSDFRFETFSRQYLPLPPKKEQDEIVSFINEKTKAIDNLISDKENLITLLAEERQAIISEAITKGLDTKAPMKDSGVEWIGEIPVGWEVGKIGYCYSSQLGKMLQPNQKDETETKELYLCAIDLRQDCINTQEERRMWFSQKEKDIYALSQGDLLVVEGGATVGTSHIYKDTKCVYFQNALHRLRPKKSNLNSFLNYWIKFIKHRGYLDLVCNVATFAHYTKEKLVETSFLIIPKREQEQIVQYLDEKTRKIDQITTDTKEQIKLLKEYRQSLISEVVTGKIEV